ncbi:MAG: hypothetical protein IT462_04815 [Planctomycetes bacterium]|nr:hypothetical protein [Planctomycetota bacterium]
MSITLAHCRKHQPMQARKLSWLIAAGPLLTLGFYSVLVVSKLTSKFPSDTGTGIAVIGILGFGFAAFLSAIGNYWSAWKKTEIRSQNKVNDHSR